MLVVTTGAILSACPGRTTDDSNTAGAASGSAESAPTGASGAKPDIERVEVDLLAFGRQLGQIAPCGCTSLPLGGLDFAFGYIEAESKAGQRLVLEPGSFLYPDPHHPEAPRDAAGWAQAEQRAQALTQRFAALGTDLVSGLGPTDFANPEGPGLAAHALPRTLANLEDAKRQALPEVEAARVVTLGHEIEAVVTAVVDPSAVRDIEALGTPTEPVAAAKAALAAHPDAELSVVMVAGPRTLAEQIARELEVDVVIMGGEIASADEGREGQPPAKVGDTWLLEPGDRAQTLSHLTLRLAADAPAEAAAGEWKVLDSAAQIDAQIAQLDERLAKFKADPSADPKFVARVQAERDALLAQKDAPGDPSAKAIATFAQAAISCMGKSDDAAKQALKAYDAWVAKEMKARFEGVKAPAPAKGEAGYVGMEACADCHSEAAKFWEGTIHAGAYETLERANKQYDLTCVGCHVTGFRKPGGSEVVENAGLVDVQCEQCHGPGSLHIEDPDTTNIRRAVPETVCGECHTPEHSDTFDYKPYLRDILGPGHGADARQAIGSGPTGGELRAKALQAAGGGCKKM